MCGTSGFRELKARAPGALSSTKIWVFLEIGDPFLGCHQKQSLLFWLILGILNFDNSEINLFLKTASLAGCIFGKDWRPQAFEGLLSHRGQVTSMEACATSLSSRARDCNRRNCLSPAVPSCSGESDVHSFSEGSPLRVQT